MKRSFGGTIHIRNAGTPPRTYDTPLEVNLQTGWNTLSDASSGLTFSLPMFGAPLTEENLGSTTGSIFVIDVEVNSVSDNTARSLLKIIAYPNPSRLTLQQWFEQNIDDSSGTLLSSGAFQQEQLSNDGRALVGSGAFPVNYQGAPVAAAYLLASSGTRVYAIKQSQDLQLTDLGYQSSSVLGVLTSILGSVQ